MKIQALNKFIGVVYENLPTNHIIMSDCVGLEKVKIYSISDTIKETLSHLFDVQLKEGSEIYILQDTKQYPYVTLDDKKIFFVDYSNVVAYIK